MDNPVIAAMRDVIDLHNKAIGLDTNQGPNVDIWNLLVSILDYCAHENVNFDWELYDAQCHHAQMTEAA